MQLLSKIKLFIKETLRDFGKDNVKWIWRTVLVFIISQVLIIIKKNASKKLVIGLPIIFIVGLVLLGMSIWIIMLHRKNKKLKDAIEDLKNPFNVNVNKFFPGDIVILKSEKDLPNSPIMSVYKIHKSEIECRRNDELKKYAPEELFTKDETYKILDERENEMRRNQEAYSNIFKEYNPW